jgi:hypothetical protein
MIGGPLKSSNSSKPAIPCLQASGPELHINIKMRLALPHPGLQREFWKVFSNKPQRMWSQGPTACESREESGSSAFHLLTIHFVSAGRYHGENCKSIPHDRLFLSPNFARSRPPTPAAIVGVANPVFHASEDYSSVSAGIITLYMPGELEGIHSWRRFETDRRIILP